MEGIPVRGRTAGKMGIYIVILIIAHHCEAIEGTSDDFSNIELEFFNTYEKFCQQN